MTKVCSDSESGDIKMNDEALLEHDFDQDFSESSSVFSDSGEQVEDINDDILRTLPACLREKCPLPRADFMWHCPVPDCNYVMNLRKFKKKESEALTPEIRRGLRREPCQRLSDRFIWQAFTILVNLHYNQHMERLGIRFFKDESGKVRLKWSKATFHPAWPPDMGHTAIYKKIDDDGDEIEIDVN